MGIIINSKDKVLIENLIRALKEGCYIETSFEDILIRGDEVEIEPGTEFTIININPTNYGTNKTNG